MKQTNQGIQKQRVWGYARVSTTKQRDGESIDTQIRKLSGYALQQGFKIDEVFVDEAVSGSISLADRPQGKKLMSVVRPRDIILVSKLDRAFRASADALSCVDLFTKQSISLVLLDMGGDVCGADGAGRLFFSIVSAFSQFESERIGERIRDVKRHMKSEGKFLGGSRNLGFQVDDRGFLVPDKTEQRIISEILALRNQGFPIRKIAAQVSSSGRCVSHSTVHRVIKRQQQG